MLKPDPKVGFRLPKVLHPRLPGASEGCTHPQVTVVPGAGPPAADSSCPGTPVSKSTLWFCEAKGPVRSHCLSTGVFNQNVQPDGRANPTAPAPGKASILQGSPVPGQTSRTPSETLCFFRKRVSSRVWDSPGVPPGPRLCRVGLSVQLRPSPGSRLPSAAALCRGAPASVPTSQQPPRQPQTHTLQGIQPRGPAARAGRGRGRPRDLSTLPCPQRNMRTFTPSKKNEDSETASHFRFCLHVRSCWVGFCRQMGYDFGFASWRLQGRGYDHLCDPQRLQEAHRAGFVCPEPLRPMTGGARTH